MLLQKVAFGPPVLASGIPGLPDTGALLRAALPEVVLTAGIAAILLLDAFGKGGRNLFPRLSMALLVGLFLWTFKDFRGGTVEAGPLVVDDMARLFRFLFYGSGILTLAFAARQDEGWFAEAEFHALFLASLAGMSVLSASRDMLTAYLAFETVSYTGYLMVGYRKGDRASSEAGLKYVVFGAAASGAMLYGISLLFGLAGSTSMDAVADHLALRGPSPAAIAGAVLVFAGVAFKVSAAPFHFWAPDAYAGASTPVAGFLAVASKAAGFAVAVRILGTWCGPMEGVVEGGAFLPSGPLPLWICAAGAVATMVVGNTAALRQKELKRLLAWSSVAHAGYLLMALSTGKPEAVGGLHAYFWIYMLMTLGGFGIVGLLAPRLGGTEIRHYEGLGRRNPWLAASLTVLLVSLTGLPPTLGFWGKVLLFMPVIEAKLYGLAVVGLLMSAVSLFYYVSLVRAMYLVPPAEGNGEPVPLTPVDNLLVGLCCIPLLVLGLGLMGGPVEMFLRTASDWAVAAAR
jgi:NADH-quinone oxidoreductase subunit N